jgi:hypothetical protein
MTLLLLCGVAVTSGPTPGWCVKAVVDIALAFPTALIIWWLVNLRASFYRHVDAVQQVWLRLGVVPHPILRAQGVSRVWVPIFLLPITIWIIVCLWIGLEGWAF